MDDTQGLQSTPAEEEDTDLTDELPDYSLLHTLTSQGHHVIPRRGEKDFEPHGTMTQQQLLDASLEAMIDILSGLRTHTPAAHVFARYDSASGRAVVEKPKGHLFNTLGKGESGGQIGLSQEELLYLVERGSLDGRASDKDSAMSLLPFSLQQTYSSLTELPLEAYTVYAGLRRNGYIVSRAPKPSSDSTLSEATHVGMSLGSSYKRCLGKWWSSASEHSMTLLKPGLFRSIEAIQRVLSIVPFHDARQAPNDTFLTRARDRARGPSEPHSIASSSLLRTLFYVWKPRPVFKKSVPGGPDFQMAVLGTGESPFPKLWELDELLTRTAPTTLEADKTTGNNVYARLRNRKRMAFFAVVDQGIVSYVKVTDAQFGRERLQRNSGTNIGKGVSKRVEPSAKAK